ncbi:MAG: O-antigen ligase family protein [Bacteroidota bacterium]
MTVSESLPDSRFSLQLSGIIFIALILAIVGLTFSIAASSIGLTLAIVGWIAASLYERRRLIEKTPLDYFFIAYIVVELLSSALAVYKWDSFVNSKRLLLISVVYLVTRYVTTEKKAIAFVSLLGGVTALLSVIELFDYFELHPERLFLFQHYMTTGGIKMIVLLLFLPFLLHRDTPNWFRAFGLVAAIPILLALVLTFTRSSWLGFLGGCITIGILKNKYVIPVLVLVVILFLLFAPSQLRERAYSIVDPNHPNNIGRVHLWTTGIKIFHDHPILGVGDSDLHRIYDRYRSPGDIEPGGHLHDNILMWLVTLGIVGCIVLISLFVRIFSLELSAFRALKDHWLEGSLALGAVAVFVGFHINGLFEWNFGDQEIILLFWFTVGITLAAQRLPRSGELRFRDGNGARSS